MYRDDDLLAQWQDAERKVLSHSNDPIVNRLIQAVNGRESLSVVYHGGSTPGGRRTITPTEVFWVEDYRRVYVRAYCQLRGEERVFRVDRLSIPGLKGTGCLVAVCVLCVNVAGIAALVCRVVAG
jgi:predicted DNA-binding transcriptional regulator YafY